MKIVIVDSGVANLASVESAFRSLGVPVRRSRSAGDLEQASHIVLPGVGSFGAGISRIRQSGLEKILLAHVASGKALLAVCLGLQLLCEQSDESPGLPGLGVVKGRCRRLPTSVRVPQLGWNYIEPAHVGTLVQPGMAAFANSYALFDVPIGWNHSTTRYGERFVSALEKDNVLACQFHPELSGGYGLSLIERWLETSGCSLSENRRPENRNSTRHTPVPERVIDGQQSIRIIPCLDVRDGRVVKGVRFQNLRDAGDPAELAMRYELQGADEIVVLDIAASPRGIDTRLDTVRRVRSQLHIPLTVGGGVRTVVDARRLLEAGADKISVNSAATRDPRLITRLAGKFGSQCVVCAIDARQTGDSWEVLVNGGRESTMLNAVSWSRQAESRGAGEILLTSWDRDGTRSGADNPLLAAVSSAVGIPVIASGGIGTADDAVSAVTSGASAVLAASIFHDAELEVGDLKKYLKKEGLGVRL